MSPEEIKSLEQDLKKYKDYYENSPDMYASLDAKTGCIKECNQTLVEKLGYDSKSEILGCHVFDIYHPDCHSEVKEAFESFVSSGEVDGAQLILMKKGGGKLEVLLHVSSVKNKDGSISASRSTWKEITPIKNKILKNKKLFEVVFRDAPYAKLMIEPSGKIKLANAKARALFGYSENELVGKNIKKLIQSEKITSQILDFFKNEKKSNKHTTDEKSEIIAIKKDHSEFYINLYPTLCESEIGEKRLIVSIIDLTVFKKYQERLELAIEGSKDGLWDWFDIDSSKEWWSPSFYHILGYQNQEIEACLENFDEMLHPEDKEKTFSAVEKALKGEQDFNIEYRLKTKNGAYKWINGKAKVYRNQQGKAVRMAGTISDIDQQKNTLRELQKREAELRKANEILEFIQEETNDGWWDWDLTGDATNEYLSPKWKALFGYKDNELENKTSSWQDMIFKEDLEIATENFHKHIQSNGAYPYIQEVRYKHRNGKTIWVICRGRAFKNQNGDYDRMVGTHTDITALKEAEIDLKRSNQELEQFAYITSHDLQEPLRKIMAYGDILKEDCREKLDEQDMNSIEIMTNAAERMSQLIDDILQYSRSGRHSDNEEEIDLNTLMKDIVDKLEIKVKENKAKIQISKMPVIFANKIQILQLFQNLIENAIKFKKKSIAPEINIKCTSLANGLARISVIDNGIGFKPELTHKILKPFGRLHSRSEYSGTGIGLAICKKVAEFYGGSLEAHGKPDQGSEFAVVLPTKNRNNHAQ